MTIEALDKLGLEKNETAILRVLLEKPEDITLAELSRRTSLPQTTVHRTIDMLVSKGLLVWSLDNQGKKVELGNLAAYAQTLEQEQSKIQASIDALSQLGNMIESSVGATARPQVRYYEKEHGIKQLIWNTLKAKDTLYVYTNAMRREITGSRWLTNYCSEFVERGIRDQVLCDATYAAQSYQKYGGREKYFATADDFAAISDERVFKSSLMRIRGETYIYNDILAMYTWEAGNLVGCEVQSKFIADTQRSIFETLWQQTSPEDKIDNFLANHS